MRFFFGYLGGQRAKSKCAQKTAIKYKTALRKGDNCFLRCKRGQHFGQLGDKKQQLTADQHSDYRKHDKYIVCSPFDTIVFVSLKRQKQCRAKSQYGTEHIRRDRDAEKVYNGQHQKKFTHPSPHPVQKPAKNVLVVPPTHPPQAATQLLEPADPPPTADPKFEPLHPHKAKAPPMTDAAMAICITVINFFFFMFFSPSKF